MSAQDQGDGIMEPSHSPHIVVAAPPDSLDGLEDLGVEVEALDLP